MADLSTYIELLKAIFFFFGEKNVFLCNLHRYFEKRVWPLSACCMLHDHMLEILFIGKCHSCSIEFI
jgi:hypothetical protein